MLFCGPFFGRIFDNFGHSYLVMVGTALHVGGLSIASFMDTYYGLLLSQAVCSALGASMVFYPSVACVGPIYIFYTLPITKLPSALTLGSSL